MRLKLSRGEALRWTAHRDFVEAVREALLEANLPVARGTRGTAVASAGPALPAGFVSSAEYFDAALTAPAAARRFREELAGLLPASCEALWAGRVPPLAPHLRAAVRSQRYRAPRRVDPSKAERFHQAPEWPLVQEKKGKQRVLDLKQSVSALQAGRDCVVLEILARACGMPTPAEVMASVFGHRLDPAGEPPIERVAVRLEGAPAS